MWNPRPLLFVLCLPLLAQAPSPAPSLGVQVPESQQGPQLLPGEGLAVSGPDGTVKTYGEAQRETPMGSLAKLVWLRLEGDEWSVKQVSFNCTGQMGGVSCWKKEGHGRVDLSKALDQSCNLAFLAWARASCAYWKDLVGEGAARVRLEECFSPFLGLRLAPSPDLPAMGPEWIGDGELLRTSPEAFLKWLMHPDQEELMRRWRRLSLGFVRTMVLEAGWWIKTGTAPVPGAPGETYAWVAGSNGKLCAVLRLPRGKGRSDGLERFQAILGLPDKKKK